MKTLQQRRHERLALSLTPLPVELRLMVAEKLRLKVNTQARWEDGFRIDGLNPYSHQSEIFIIHWITFQDYDESSLAAPMENYKKFKESFLI